MTAFAVLIWSLALSGTIGCGLPLGQTQNLDGERAGRASSFDGNEFRNRIADLPRGAGWAQSFNRNAYLVNALQASGWQEHGPDGPGDELAQLIVRSLLEGVMDRSFAHQRDQRTTVAVVTEDLARICGIQKRHWMKATYSHLNQRPTSLEVRTAMGVAQGSGFLEPDEGHGILARYGQLNLFVVIPEGRRDLFQPEYLGLLHYMMGADRIAMTLWLYRTYPGEAEALGDPLPLLAELEHFLRMHALAIIRQRFRDGKTVLDVYDVPPPREIQELIVRLVRDGGRPGEALGYRLYTGDPSFRAIPELKQALLDAQSDFARWRFKELREEGG